MKLLEAFLDLLFPLKCPFCGRVLEKPGICPTCEKNLPWIEGREGLREGAGGLRCAGAVWYEGLAREGLLRLKFQGASAAAEPMGDLVARCAAEHFSGEFDTVTWVPVSKQRLKKRGFDQSRMLCASLCVDWHVEPQETLRKITDNPPQSGLDDPAARRANVLNVYEAVEPAAIRGKRFLLIDDILTTGATLSECVRILREAGAADVVCLTLAMVRDK